MEKTELEKWAETQNKANELHGTILAWMLLGPLFLLGFGGPIAVILYAILFGF